VRLKGTMTIELTDRNTSEVKTIVEENMVTNAVNCILGLNPMGVFYKEGRKHKRFCSDLCRNRWWNSHLDLVKRKAHYEYVCPACKTAFSVYGNANRKYCSHACYIRARFGKG